MEMSVTERVREGEYKTKLPYPERVKEPEILSRRARDLTSDEVASIARVKAQYEADKIACDKARKAYSEDERRLESQFKADLEAEYKMIGHPKADLLWGKAWDHGHANGLHEVAFYYGDFVELVL